MFELMLMRHAKSDWRSHSADIDRPLNSRGNRNAVRMGAYLNRVNLVPDLMVVSKARRTQETAELLTNNLPVSEERIIIDESLYLASRKTLIEIIEQYERDDQRLLVLAHNPGMDDLVSYLASAAPSLSERGKLMTTCAVACFAIGSLDALKKPGLGELQNLIRPKEIVGV